MKPFASFLLVSVALSGIAGCSLLERHEVAPWQEWHDVADMQAQQINALASTAAEPARSQVLAYSPRIASALKSAQPVIVQSPAAQVVSAAGSLTGMGTGGDIATLGVTILTLIFGTKKVVERRTENRVRRQEQQRRERIYLADEDSDSIMERDGDVSADAIARKAALKAKRS